MNLTALHVRSIREIHNLLEQAQSSLAGMAAENNDERRQRRIKEAYDKLSSAAGWASALKEDISL